MLNYDDSDATLCGFYGIRTLDPRTSADLQSRGLVNDDDVDLVSPEINFKRLTDIVNDNTGHVSNVEYAFGSEDVEDPFRGRGTNVVEELLRRHIVELPDDPMVKKFLISSQKFDSQVFLTTVHSDSSVEQLMQLLQFLERDIQNQTAQLRQVIDENYIKFVDCKRTIDDILFEFKSSKTYAQQERDSSKVYNPLRQRKLQQSESLAAELEESLQNINIASNLMIGPIIESKNKESKLNKVIEFIRTHSFFFDLPSNLIRYLAEHNHDQFIDDYQRFLKEKEEYLAAQNYKHKSAISRPDGEYKDEYQKSQAIINTILLRVFAEIDNIVNEFRKKAYKDLLSMDYEVSTSKYRSKNASNAKFMTLVDKIQLLDSTPSTSPISEFLHTQLDNLSRDFTYQSTKFESKFNGMQSKLGHYMSSLPRCRDGGSQIRFIADKYTSVEAYLRASSNSASLTDNEKDKIILEVFESSDNLDLSIVSETWLVLVNFMSYIDDFLSRNVSKFVTNYAHYHKELASQDHNQELWKLFSQIILDITSNLLALFKDDAAGNQLESAPESYSLFLPHHTNSLSALHYLSILSSKLDEIFTRMGAQVATVGNVSKNVDTNKLIKSLRSSSASITQKLVEAACSVWINDCSQFYDLEEWQEVHPKNEGGRNGMDSTYTRTMNILEGYEVFVLNKLAKLVFSTSQEDKVRIVAAHPSKRILMSIEIQFMRSLKNLVDSIMKRYTIEKSSEQNTRMKELGLYKILTMNNYDKVSRLIYPRLILVFDKLFDRDLLQQNLKLYVDIDKAGLTILDDFLNEEKHWIESKVNKHFQKIMTFLPTSNSLRVDSFIYEVLVHLVKLVHFVKPITAPDVFVSIMNELQTSFLKMLLECLRAHSHIDNLQGYIGNFKMDVNFFVEVFEGSNYLRLNDISMSTVEITLQMLNEIERETTYSDRQFDDILMKNLKDSEYEFDCFL